MTRAALAVAMTLGAASALAQVPAGAEFRVNTTTTQSQVAGARSVAVAANGDFVIVWDTFGITGVIRGQRYDATGAPLGGEFQVSTNTLVPQDQPLVAMGRRGEFVVVWTAGDEAGQGGNYGVVARRFDRTGTPIGAEFAVNAYTLGEQYATSIATSGAGRFLVVWTSWLQDGSATGTFARLYGSAGAPIGPEFQVNTYTSLFQDHAAAGMDAAGNCVVAWESALQDGSGTGVYAQRFDADGGRIGGELLVPSYTTNSQDDPGVAVHGDGSFVVVWSDAARDGSFSGVFGRRFDPTGNAVGPDFQVNSYTTDSQRRARVAGDEIGTFTVAWTSLGGQDGDTTGVFARRFQANTGFGPELQVNTYTTGNQDAAAIAMDWVGNFAVDWTGPDGDADGVFAQRFGGLIPTALRVDTTGNGVLEPGELTDVRPIWRNITDAALAINGMLGNPGGPPGGEPVLSGPATVYGTVPDGATGECSGCYRVFIPGPAPRPALHWDGTTDETTFPIVLGQQKRWRLHVGASFTDVPPANPFYWFVETILHKDITGGCGATTYCPSSPTTREQMAVFLLLAKEASTFAPPACGPTPVFADVPVSSAFCPWIEELARRNVVAGCGGGNYCPDLPVTREQMAVFVLRTLDPALNPPACTVPVFNDVPASSPFCRWVEDLARRGVVTGCGGGAYCPTLPVTREQMSVFLTMTFGLQLYGP